MRQLHEIVLNPSNRALVKKWCASMGIPSAHEMVFCRSDAGDGGWSLHAPGSTDEAIASGAAPCLVSGTANRTDDGGWDRPNYADYVEANIELASRMAALRLRHTPMEAEMALEITPDVARRHILESMNGDEETRSTLIDAVKEWANCLEVDVSEEGNIWIRGCANGSWLNDDDLVEFLNWAEKQ